MTRPLAVAVCLSLAAFAPYARAADPAHTLAATCDSTVPLGYDPSVATARAGGHLRVVSTEVTCLLTDEYGGSTVALYQALPGPVAVAAGVMQVALIAPQVCVLAVAYWSDGDSLSVTSCGTGSTSVQGSS